MFTVVWLAHDVSWLRNTFSPGGAACPTICVCNSGSVQTASSPLERDILSMISFAKIPPIPREISCRNNNSQHLLSTSSIQETRNGSFGTRTNWCVLNKELCTFDWYFLWGCVRSNLSKPCSVPKLLLCGSHLDGLDYNGAVHLHITVASEQDKAC